MSILDVSQIIAYEQGDLGEDETIGLFQQLVDTGLAWSLQGHYGRTAIALIEAGYVTRPDCEKRHMKVYTHPVRCDNVLHPAGPHPLDRRSCINEHEVCPFSLCERTDPHDPKIHYEPRTGNSPEGFAAND